MDVPPTLRKLFTPIEKLGKLINRVVNTVILSIEYIFGVGFTHILMRVSSKEKKHSGWEPFEMRDSQEDYYRQF